MKLSERARECASHVPRVPAVIYLRSMNDWSTVMMRLLYKRASGDGVFRRWKLSKFGLGSSFDDFPGAAAPIATMNSIQ